MIFWNKDSVILRTAEEKDIDAMKDLLRATDVREVLAAANQMPEEALRQSFAASSTCMTLEYQGRPVAMCGIVPESIIGQRAVIWLLGTDEIRALRKTFHFLSKRCIEYFLDMYPYLYNWVDDRNKETMVWLQRCGAEFLPAVPFGHQGLPFRYFVLRRKK